MRLAPPLSQPARLVLRQGRALALALCLVLLAAANTRAADDPLPSWNEGPVKTAVLDFVRKTTDPAGPEFVPPGERVATFDQDGTTWVEQPLYTQIRYCLDRVPGLVREKPGLKDVEPFKTVLSGDKEAMTRLSMAEIMKIVAATLTGMTVEAFDADVKAWLETAKDPRWNRPYTELAYQPMLEVLRFFRDNGYATYMVTGSEQDFVRVYAGQVYGLAPGQVVGSAETTRFGYDAAGRPTLTKEPKLLLDDDHAGKPEGIHLVIGQRPRAAFGNSVGDKEMLEYAQAGPGARLMVLVHHDDAGREYAYGPDSKIGTFSDALMAEAVGKGWLVVSMKNDWKRIFAWEK